MGLELNHLVWDEFNSRHILKHRVTITEVEEACTNQLKVFSARAGRILLIGKTNSGRFLSIVLAKIDNGNFYLVTARDSSRKERRLI